METRERLTAEKLNVLAARLTLWLLDLLLWLSEWMGRTLPRALRLMLREDMRMTLAGVRVIVFLRAVSRCPPSPVEPGWRNAPRGFRCRGLLDNDLRNVCRTVRLRGRTLAARLGDLRDVLNNLDAWVARAMKRLRGGAHGAALVMCFVVGDRLRVLMTHTTALVDSS